MSPLDATPALPGRAESGSHLLRLRAGTRDAHAQIETVPALSRLLAHDLQRHEYIAVLRHMEAFHAAIEPAIAAALAPLPEAAAMLDGSRPAALMADLAWFGVSPLLPLAAPPDLPQFEGPADALGALYVIEGSGLGGRVIARHLSDRLGVAAGAGGSFYGRLSAEEARSRWQLLSRILEAPVAGDVVVAGALATFSSLDRWLRSIAFTFDHPGDVEV